MTLVASTPSDSPELWARFLDGAWTSYSRHGVTCALDLEQVASGATTAMFYVVLGREGNMLGGVRAQGPYTLIEQSHVLAEWQYSPGLSMVADKLQSRITEGIVEMKSAWVSPGASGTAVSVALAGTSLPTIELTGSRYLFASAADHVLRLWETSGGRIDTDVPVAAYPSDRYRTRLMWWDRETLARRAQPATWQIMLDHCRALAGGERLGAAVA